MNYVTIHLGSKYTVQVVRFAYRFTVDSHELSALAKTIIGEKERSEITFHSSPFNLPSLAFLETYTEANFVDTGTWGVGGAPS